VTVVICGTCQCHPCVCCVPSMPAPPMPWPSMLGTPIVVPLDHRQSFIRAAAAALLAGQYARSGAPGYHGYAEAWRMASDLWDAKPEDC
jgi:hypothetical protein